jgi:hypothetical protein
MRRAAIAVALLLFTISFTSSMDGGGEPPAALAARSSSTAGYPEGIVKVGHIEVKLDHEVVHAILSQDLIAPVMGLLSVPLLSHITAGA